MTLYFSPSSGGFYDTSIHGALGGANCIIPADAVEISEEVHAELMQAQVNGKVITAVAGRPVAVDRVLSPAEVEAHNRNVRAQLLAQSDWSQLPDALANAPEYKAAMAKWRQALRDMDLATGSFPEPPTR